MRTYHIYHRIIGSLLLFSVVALLFMGCKRRPLEEREMNVVEVLVELDWRRSSVNPTEATVIFYDENGNSPRTLYLVSNRGVIKLPLGKYSVLAFNDKIGDFNQLRFSGVDNYKTIEVSAIELPRTNYGKMTDNNISEYPNELLASASLDSFEVTKDMLDQTIANKGQINRALTRGEAHLKMEPIDVVATTKIVVHVENMYLIRSGSQRGTIKGFSSSVLLHNRQNSSKSMTHVVPFTYAQYYATSEKDGFMSEQFTTLGICPTKADIQPISLLFEAVLRDKEQTKFSYQKDITKFVDVKTEVGLKINIEIGIDPHGDNPPVPIPSIIPIDDGAFRPGVSEWDEKEVIKPL